MSSFSAPEPGTEGSDSLVATSLGHVGPYELLGRLGTGGMAEILLARLSRGSAFEKYFVIKRVLPVLANRPDFIEMFLDEARTAAGLVHPNIVHVYDLGYDNGSHYLAMEYLDGRDLHGLFEALRGSPLPLEHVVAIGVGVCAGLHHAHERTDKHGEPLSIVHRDVTPQNIFVTYEGAVKVLDFGIAKAAHQITKTRTGALKGKAGYMAPEQVRSEELDRRCDIFCLGTVLWELVTGQRLFSGKSEFEAMCAVVGDEPLPTPRSVMPTLPAPIEEIVMKALARDPADRYPSAEAMQLDLEAFARSHSLTVSQVHLRDFIRGLFPKDFARTPIERCGIGEHSFVSEVGSAPSEPPGQPISAHAPTRALKPDTGAGSAPAPAPVITATEQVRYRDPSRSIVRPWMIAAAASAAVVAAAALFLWATGAGIGPDRAAAEEPPETPATSTAEQDRVTATEPTAEPGAGAEEPAAAPEPAEEPEPAGQAEPVETPESVGPAEAQAGAVEPAEPAEGTAPAEDPPEEPGAKPRRPKKRSGMDQIGTDNFDSPFL